MGTWLVALALSTGIPIAALVVISLSLGHLDRMLLDAIIAEAGPLHPDVVASLRLATLCQDPLARADLGPACDDVRLGGHLQTLAAAAIAVSLIVLAAVIPVAAIGRRNRVFLGISFRPVLLGVLIGILFVIVADGALVVGAVYLAMGAYLGIVYPWLLAVLGLAALVAVLGVVRAMASMARTTPVPANGIALSRAEDGRLFDLVDEVARSVGTDPPAQIIAGLDPTFFVIDAPLTAFGERFDGRTLFVSVPLARILDIEEFRAIVGHELAHFKGADTEYSRMFAPGYRGATQSLDALRASAGSWSGIPLLAPLWLLTACLERFGSAERDIGRVRELAADQVGATVASPVALAAALLKLEAHSGAWGDVFSAAMRAVLDGRPAGNVSEQYAARARVGAAAAVDANLPRIPHPFDSHPPTAARLEALAVGMAEAADRATTTDPADPAISLLGRVEELELELSERLEDEIGSELGVAPGDEPAGSDRSIALRAAAAADPALEAVVRLFERVRGPDLGRPLVADDSWVTLADLELEPHPEPIAFHYLVPDADLPGGDQQLVVGPATARTDRARVLPAGSRLRLAALSGLELRRAGIDEACYIDAGAQVREPRLVVVRGVGTGTVEHQLGGLFVVPETDVLASRRGPLRQEFAAVLDALAARGEPH